MSTALVTGGAGFIGSHLVDLLLERGHEVRVVDLAPPDKLSGVPPRLLQHAANSGLNYEPLDIRSIAEDDDIWRDVDWVFHLAALADIVPSIRSPTRYISVNVTGTARVLEAARRRGVKKVVYAASGSCYGAAPPVPTSESAPIDARYPYAMSKFMGELAALHWYQVYGLPVNSLRVFNAYGPRARTSGAYGAVLGVWLRQVLAGAPLTIVGDGDQQRDFVHVCDVARAFLLAAETELSGMIWNVGSGKPRSINELACLVGGVRYPVIGIPDRPGEPRVTWADVETIRDDLGWRPEVDFIWGMEDMRARIEDWREAPLWTPEKIAEATADWHRHLGRAQ